MKTNNEKNKLNMHETKDIGEASALIASGQYLLDTSKEGTHLNFLFDNSENISNKLSDEYWFGNLVVNARQLVEAMRYLKRKIHENK